MGYRHWVKNPDVTVVVSQLELIDTNGDVLGPFPLLGAAYVMPIRALTAATDTVTVAGIADPLPVSLASIPWPNPPSAISEFSDITPNGSAARFTSTATACKGIVIVANPGNAANMRVGDSSVSASKGAVVPPGASIPIAIGDVSKVYVYGAAGTDSASISYVS